MTDADIGGTNLHDARNGTDCLQYNYGSGKMPGFNWINFTVDTHFHHEGRIGRIAPFMIDMKVPLSIGIDENTSLFY